MPFSTDTQLRIAGRGLIKLAPGIRLSMDSERSAALMLAVGQVRLNQHALAILKLCDGTRTRDRVVVDAMMLAGGSMRTTDAVEFLDAAFGRGWIIEELDAN